jgi:two-component system sensor histidine kinase/response regulator
MGGELTVNSVPGEGSTFLFTICCRAADARIEPETKARRPSAESILSGVRVLVAEDNPINQQLALEYLQRAGASVDIAETGRHAITAVAENHYDVVLMDIHMPQTDGLEATATIRQHGLTVPIIAVSADALSERKAQALAVGCDDYVTKPIDFDVLLAALERLLPKQTTVRRRRATDVTRLAFEDASTDLGLELPRVPGIDLGEAIRHHKDNIRLMIKLMGDFGHYSGDAAAKLKDFIQTQKYDEAERLTHNLHGVAGSFGAQRLKEAAKTLELALAKDDRNNLHGMVQSFEIALAEVLESAEALASDEIRFRASDFDAVRESQGAAD